MKRKALYALILCAFTACNSSKLASTTQGSADAAKANTDNTKVNTTPSSSQSKSSSDLIKMNEVKEVR